MQLEMIVDTKPAGAVVIAFPLHRRAGLVRDIARELGARDYVAGRKFWSVHVKALRAELRAIGIPCREVEAEIRRYANAISRILELPKQSNSTPDSAA